MTDTYSKIPDTEPKYCPYSNSSHAASYRNMLLAYEPASTDMELLERFLTS